MLIRQLSNAPSMGSTLMYASDLSWWMDLSYSIDATPDAKLCACPPSSIFGVVFLDHLPTGLLDIREKTAVVGLIMLCKRTHRLSLALVEIESCQSGMDMVCIEAGRSGSV